MPVDKHIKTAKFLSTLLDNQFDIAGVKFGIDPIIGFMPVLGDILPATVSVYMMWIGHKVGVPKEKIAQMGLYAAGDVLLGLVPVLGDFIDFAYKSNAKCYEIIENHIAKDLRNGIVEGEIVD